MIFINVLLYLYSLYFFLNYLYFVRYIVTVTAV